MVLREHAYLGRDDANEVDIIALYTEVKSAISMSSRSARMVESATEVAGF
jgi:hypothetical protein